MENQELLDKYIHGELSLGEKVNFESKLKADKEFAKEFKTFLLVVQGIQKEEQQDCADFGAAMKKLSKEDYYTAVVYVFYEDRVEGFKDYSNETMNILKEAVEYLKNFVESNKNNKDIDIEKYTTAIWNGEYLIATAIIIDNTFFILQ